MKEENFNDYSKFLTSLRSLPNIFQIISKMSNIKQTKVINFYSHNNSIIINIIARKNANNISIVNENNDCSIHRIYNRGATTTFLILIKNYHYLFAMLLDLD